MPDVEIESPEVAKYSKCIQRFRKGIKKEVDKTAAVAVGHTVENQP